MSQSIRSEIGADAAGIRRFTCSGLLAVHRRQQGHDALRSGSHPVRLPAFYSAAGRRRTVSLARPAA